MKAKIKLWVEDADGNIVFGEGKRALLSAIKETGSILGASKKMELGYKKAWNHVKIVEELLSHDVLSKKQRGGVEGGGAEISEKGEELIAKYELFQKEVESFAKDKFEEIFGADGDFFNKLRNK
jgi:molybdate transport system regulatory protein